MNSDYFLGPFLSSCPRDTANDAAIKIILLITPLMQGLVAQLSFERLSNKRILLHANNVSVN